MWIAKLCSRKRIHPALLCVLCALTLIAGYIVLLTSVWALDVQLEAEMNKYDLDGDGGIGGDEWTPEAKRAMDEWASDTDRAMAPIFGVPLTTIWYTILFAFFFGGEWVFRKLFLTRSTSENQQTNSKIEEQQTDSGNPYRPPSVG